MAESLNHISKKKRANRRVKGSTAEGRSVPHTSEPADLSEPKLKLVGPHHGLIQATLEIARQRRDTLVRLCDAVERNDFGTARILAKELSGK